MRGRARELAETDKMLKYRGCSGTVEYSEEDAVYIGVIAHIRDLVIFEADDASGIVPAFEEAVDDYLEFCESEEATPNTPSRGGTDKDLHG